MFKNQIQFSILKKCYFLVISLITSLFSIAQLPVAYYDFENTTNRSLFENKVKAAVNNGATVFTKSESTTSDENGAGIANGGLQVGRSLSVYRGLDNSSTDPKANAVSFLQFKVNGSGFTGMGLNFNVYANTIDAPYYGISISTNGSSWQWVASVNTPGTGNYFPWYVGSWAAGACSFPATADNAANLYIRIYHYYATSNSVNAQLRIDNLEVTATGTMPGAIKTMLDDRHIFTNTTSGLTGTINTPNSMKRKAFTVNGNGTAVTIPYLDIAGENGQAGNLTISNNATLTISSGQNTFYIDSAKGTSPASVLNILSGGTLILNNELQCQGNIILDNGTLNLNGQKLIMGGTISRTNGLINGTTGTLEMLNKKAAQSISGSFFSGKKLDKFVNSNPYGINISNAANDTLKITGSISFGSVNNSVINTGNNLTLTSTATGTAAVADLTNNGVNSGNLIIGKVTVERFISNGAKWRLLAVPTNSTQTFKQSWQENAPTANGNPANGYGVLIGDNRSNWAASGFDIYTPGGPTVKTYNAANNTWAGITNTQTAIKNAGGYMTYIRSNRSGVLSATTIRTSGELYTGIQPVINVPANQFMVVGNPYAAEVNLTKLNTTGLQDVYYVWDPKAGGGYGLGAYQTLVKMGNDYQVFPGGGSYGAQLSVVNTIESGQAFFVKAGATGGTIQFEENDKQTGSRLVFRAPAENSPMLRATLYSVTTDTTTLLDAAMANFDTAYTNSVDADDILKIANGSENVSIKNGTSLLLADRRKDPTAQDTIRLNLTGVRIQTYKWSITMDHMIANGRTAFLKDAYTNSLTPLNMEGTTDYSFTMVNIAGAYAANRFSIVFSEALVLPVTITTVSAIRSNTNSSNVIVNWKVENEIGLQLYEVEHSNNGSTFKSFSNVNATAGNSGSTAYTQLHTQAIDADNFYRIKAISLSGLVQYSAIVKVAAIKKGSTPAISVYPNPVVNKNMNVQFLNQPAGTYQVKLLNQSGSVIYQNKVDINNSNALKMMQLNNSTAAGIYQLVITDGNAGKSVMQVVIL